MVFPGKVLKFWNRNFIAFIYNFLFYFYQVFLGAVIASILIYFAIQSRYIVV